MAFFEALIREGLVFVVTGAAAFGAVLLGIWLRKRKNAATEAQENE